jgi:hypothetical protein
MTGRTNVEPQMSAAALLLRKMKRTKGTRFNAAERLKMEERLEIWLIVVISIGIVGWSLIDIAFGSKLKPWQKDLLLILNLAMAIVVIAVSLVQAGQKKAVQAERLHECALDVLDLFSELEMKASALNASELAEYAKRYTAITGKYNLNHADCDYSKYKLDNPDEFNHRIRWFTIWLGVVVAAQKHRAVVLAALLSVLASWVYFVGSALES